MRVITTFSRVGDEFDPRLIVVAADIFGIGRVEHEKHVLGQAGMQAADFLEGQIGAGRIVRVGEEDDLRLRRDGGEDGVDIGALLGFLDRDRHGAGSLDVDLVDQEAVLGEDRLVAGRKVGLGEQAEELVGAVGADDIGSVQPMRLGDRLAQPRRRAVRIEFELAGDLAHRLDRLRRRAERVLVRGQLVDLGHAAGAALLPGT